jgi:hypothetical protein
MRAAVDRPSASALSTAFALSSKAALPCFLRVSLVYLESPIVGPDCAKWRVPYEEADRLASRSRRTVCPRQPL